MEWTKQRNAAHNSNKQLALSPQSDQRKQNNYVHSKKLDLLFGAQWGICTAFILCKISIRRLI